MISRTWVSSPSDERNSDKPDSSSFTNVTLSKVTLRTHKSKKKRAKRSHLDVVCEEADSQTDSSLIPNEANMSQEISLNLAKIEKYSKNKIHNKTSFKLQKPIEKIENRSCMKNAVALCKMDSSVIKAKENTFSKKRLSLSPSYLDHAIKHIISDDNDTTHCSSKSLDQSNQYKNHKKVKRKHKPNSNELGTNSSSENIGYDYKFDQNEKRTSFHNQDLSELSESNSYPESSNGNYVSTVMSSSLATKKKKKSNVLVCNQPKTPETNQSPSTKYNVKETQNSQEIMLNNTSYIFNKKPKKKRGESSSFLEINQIPTILKEEKCSDKKEPNQNIVDSVTPQKHTLSVSSVEVFDENPIIIDEFSNNLCKYQVSQNHIKTKQKNLDNNNGICNQIVTTTKKTKKNHKDKSFNIVNVSNHFILNAEPNKKEITANSPYKVSTKSFKNNLIKELILAESNKINVKPPNKISAVKTNPKTTSIKKVKHVKTKTSTLLSNEYLSGNFAESSDEKNVNKHSMVLLNNKIEDIKCKQDTVCLSKDKPFDIDQLQQELLAAALKKLNKSSKSKNIKRPVKNSNYIESNEEANKEMKNLTSQILLESNNESNSVLQTTTTIQDIGTISDVEFDKKKKTSIHKTNKRSSTLEAVKHKTNLKQDKKLDIKQIQQELIAAALKKVNLTPTESKILEKPYLYQCNNIELTKGNLEKRNESPYKCEVEHQQKSKVVSKRKLNSKPALDPLEDFTTKLLLAEMKKRKKDLKTLKRQEK